MPTPSSDQPPVPSSSESPTSGFSTCPDEPQHPPTRETEVETDSRQLQAHEGHDLSRSHSPASVESNEPARHSSGDNSSPARDSFVASEGAVSLDTSSRATTMSPRPPSSVTARTSPASERDPGDSNKRAHIDDHSNLDRITTRQPRSDISAPGCLSPELSRGVAAPVAVVASTTTDEELYAPSMGPHFPSLRTSSVSPSTFLRPGSRFLGTQQSERQVYDVQVEIKHVDMKESFLCGYLRIQGLTEDHPTLTTYFEGEIIGSKYNFYTNHDNWGATRKTDLKHWKRFSAFHPYRKQVEKGPASVSNVSERENIFMRWKEHFLVPDHRVRTITGASFEGFYYICFNQVKGEVSGIYFHSKSEKFQELELKHVPDRGCFSAVEFR